MDKDDNFAMFEEINEELKHDQMVRGRIARNGKWKT